MSGSRSRRYCQARLDGFALRQFQVTTLIGCGWQVTRGCYLSVVKQEFVANCLTLLYDDNYQTLGALGLCSTPRADSWELWWTR